jgi:hypothetical protein
VSPAHPRIAYIAVHGIGRQARGDTALAVAASFIAAAGAAFTEDPTPDFGSVRSGHLTTNSGAQHVRFIDAWWDEAVTPPPTPRILRWMLRVTPFLVFSTIAGWVGDLFAAETTSTRPDRRLFFLVGGASILVAFVLTPAVVIALVIINVIAVWRPGAFPTLTNVVRSVFGDAWLYRSEGLDTDVFPCLTATVEEAKATSNRVILVGHSQGAEIGRRLALATPVDACVWVGGALMPLAMLRTLRNSPALPWVLWVYVLLTPIMVSTLITHLIRVTVEFLEAVWDGTTSILRIALGDTDAAQRGQDASDRMFSLALADLPGMLLFVVFVTVFAGLLYWASRWPDDLRKQPCCPIIEVKSLADPVCFGTLNHKSTVRYVPIRPGRAVLHEHVAYFTKPETGFALMEPLVGEEGRPAPYEPGFRWSTYAVSITSMVGLIVFAYILGSALLRIVGQ